MNENKSYDNNTNNLSKTKTDKWVKHKKKFKPIGRERDIFMSIRINQSESDKLAKDISRTKLTKSEYIRNLIMNVNIKEKPDRDFFIILRNISNIASNMNQIAVVANSKGFIDVDAYNNNVNELREIEKKLKDKYL